MRNQLRVLCEYAVLHMRAQDAKCDFALWHENRPGILRGHAKLSAMRDDARQRSS